MDDVRQGGIPQQGRRLALRGGECGDADKCVLLLVWPSFRLHLPVPRPKVHPSLHPFLSARKGLTPALHHT